MNSLQFSFLFAVVAALCLTALSNLTAPLGNGLGRHHLTNPLAVTPPPLTDSASASSSSSSSSSATKDAAVMPGAVSSIPARADVYRSNSSSDPQLQSATTMPVHIVDTLLAPSFSSELRLALEGAELKDLVGRRGSGRALCTLLLAGLSECRGQPSALECVRKIGLHRLEASLHSKCVRSGWWRAVARSVANPVATSSSSSVSVDNASLDASSVRTTQQQKQQQQHQEKPKRDDTTFPVNYIRRSQVVVAQPISGYGRRRRYVPPEERTIAAINPELKLPIRGGALNGATARPINFGIPRELIAEAVPRTKVFAMCPVTAGWLGGRKNYAPMPKGVSGSAGRKQPYSLDPSEEYTLAQLYAHSYFAFTMFRGGTDCQRHLEILSRGAVPYFPDLGLRCRSSCLAAYPRELMREALQLPGIESWQRNGWENAHFARGKIWINFRGGPGGVPAARMPKIDFDRFNHSMYFDLADRLLNFTRRHLSCGAILSFVLRSAGFEEPPSVLIFVPQVVDYLSMCIESGAGELGLNYTTNDFSVPASIYSRKGRQKGSASPSSPSAASVGGKKQRHEKVNADGLSFPPTAAGASPPDEWPPWQRRVPSKHVAERMTLQDWEETGRRFGASGMYGGGFTWGMRVDPPPNQRQGFQALRRRILAKEFDLVIYSALFLVREGRFHSSVTDNLPLLDEVRTAMPADKVIFIDGDDNPLFDMHWGATLEEMVKSGSHMFVRESQRLDKKFKDELPPRGK